MRLLIAVASAVLATTAAARVNAQPALWDPGTGVVLAQAEMTPSEKAARSKLEAARPRTVGQAGRLDGLTPAALGILAAYLRREARRKTSKASA